MHALTGGVMMRFTVERRCPGAAIRCFYSDVGFLLFSVMLPIPINLTPVLECWR